LLLREIATEIVYERPAAWPSVSLMQPNTLQKHENAEDFGIADGSGSFFAQLFPQFLDRILDFLLDARGQ
jgi:hypothetical protein